MHSGWGQELGGMERALFALLDATDEPCSTFDLTATIYRYPPEMGG